jgi:hypothetical protein
MKYLANMKYLVNVVLLALLTGLLSSCELIAARAASEFNLAVTPDSLSVARGAEGTLTVAVTRTVNLTVLPLPISVSLDEAPAGVSAEAISIEPSDDSETMTIKVAESAAVGGPVKLELVATNTMVTKQATVNLTITD